MALHQAGKLGRKHPTKAKLQLHCYLGPALPPPPPSVYWSLAMSSDWGVMLNDQLGDCTCAAMGHAVQVITSNGDGLITSPDSEVEHMYEVIGHYVPGNPNTDNGAVETDAMQYMVTTGLAGIKADMFADVNFANKDQFKQSIALMGGNYIGVEIGQEDMDAFNLGKPWTSTSKANIVGGHALWVPDYDENWIYVLTWGKLQPASWDWFEAKCDESHAMIFWPWIQGQGIDISPSGLNRAQSEADIKAL